MSGSTVIRMRDSLSELALVLVGTGANDRSAAIFVSDLASLQRLARVALGNDMTTAALSDLYDVASGVAAELSKEVGSIALKGKK